MAVRIQLRRTKGWRKPPGAVVVSRPSRWGNPFKVTDERYADAVSAFEAWLHGTPSGRRLRRAAREELRGRDLACWCPPHEPCHADVLLAVANAPHPDPASFGEDREDRGGFREDRDHRGRGGNG